ncbi:MAG: hypothetical protein ACK4MS_14490 [Paracoccaceae bacterium]
MNRLASLTVTFVVGLATVSPGVGQTTDRAKAQAVRKNTVRAPIAPTAELTLGECMGLGGKVRSVSTSECSKTGQICVRVDPEGVIFTSCIDRVHGEP